MGEKKTKNKFKIFKTDTQQRRKEWQNVRLFFVSII